MAEGWARALRFEEMEAYSAGVVAKGINPHAAVVMDEVGVDIRSQKSERVEDLDVEFDLVVTVCPHAHDHLPPLPGNPEIRHLPFDDPPAMEEPDSDPLREYRRVRDEIRTLIEAL